MGHPSPQPQAIATEVRLPHVADAVGMALRNAYMRDAGLPDDMAMLIARLNENGNGDQRAR